MREKMRKLVKEAIHSWESDVNMSDHITDHLIANGVTVQEWISVTDKLPDEKKIIDGEVYYRNVAVRVKNLLHERIAYYDPENECWYDTGFFQLRGVTHWAEIPDWGDFAEQRNYHPEQNHRRSV